MDLKVGAWDPFITIGLTLYTTKGLRKNTYTYNILTAISAHNINCRYSEYVASYTVLYGFLHGVLLSSQRNLTRVNMFSLHTAKMTRVNMLSLHTAKMRLCVIKEMDGKYLGLHMHVPSLQLFRNLAHSVQGRI